MEGLKFVSIDHVDTSMCTFLELQKLAKLYDQEIEKERRMRDIYQIEKNKLMKYWSITSHNLRESKFKLREQVLPLEMEPFKMLEEEDLIRQDRMRQMFEECRQVEEVLMKRAEAESLVEGKSAKKEHQIWLDLLEMKNNLVDLKINTREAVTDIIYNQQSKQEVITRNSLKQRKMDLSRLRLEFKAKRSEKTLIANANKAAEEAYLKYASTIIRNARKANSGSLKRLILIFDNIVSHNFEHVSNLKEKLEKYKRLDVKLTREYVIISRKFSNLATIHAEGMRLLPQLQSLFFVAIKTKENLVKKKKELALLQHDNIILTLKADNADQEILEKKETVKTLTQKAINARRILTLACRIDYHILSLKIDDSLIKLYNQKVYLINLLNITDAKEKALSKTFMEIGPLTFKTKNLNKLWELIDSFRIAHLAVIVIYNRLLKLWEIDWSTFGLVLNDSYMKQLLNKKKPCLDAEELLSAIAE